jgi:hypothetical protein
MSTRVSGLVILGMSLAGLVTVALVWTAWAPSAEHTARTNVRREAAESAASTFVPVVTARVGETTWAVGAFDNPLGERCVELRAPSGWRAVNCPPLDEPDAGGMSVTWGGTDVAYVYGVTRGDVARVQIVTDDCERHDAVAAAGVFLSAAAFVAAPVRALGVAPDGERSRCPTL